MVKRNTLVFIVVLIIFTLAALVVLPVEEGILFKRDIRLGLDLQGGIHIVYKVDLSSVEPGDEVGAVEGVVAVLSNRINPLGVTEPVIQKQGSDRILVELPGLSITDKEKERLSSVALLEFGELAADEEEARWDNEPSHPWSRSCAVRSARCHPHWLPPGSWAYPLPRPGCG